MPSVGFSIFDFEFLIWDLEFWIWDLAFHHSLHLNSAAQYAPYLASRAFFAREYATLFERR
jgi:hypothetical protein